MKKTTFLAGLIACIIFVSCKKNTSSSDSNGISSNGNSWDVKYVATCNDPKAKVCVLYRDNTGNSIYNCDITDSTTFSKVPWIYEAHYSKDPGLTNIRTLFFSLGDFTPSNSSAPIILSIYVDGQLKNQINGEVGIFASAQYTLTP